MGSWGLQRLLGWGRWREEGRKLMTPHWEIFPNWCDPPLPPCSSPSLEVAGAGLGGGFGAKAGSVSLEKGHRSLRQSWTTWSQLGKIQA